mmetsp:Transcript_71566/g.141960  ORF Transcript_71566/g.141960 Transcript_71566/m.141960 type:complete len:316 (+) Transcript_71566:42-989(+)
MAERGAPAFYRQPQGHVVTWLVMGMATVLVLRAGKHEQNPRPQFARLASELLPVSVQGCGSALPLAFLGCEQREVLRVVSSTFPYATMSGGEVVSRALRVLKPYGLTRKNTIYGQSIGCDEINGAPGHVSTILTGFYGRTFPMGGLGGAPFVGKTGFLALSHLVPDRGHVFVLFGPHIGFSPTSEAGKFQRAGQSGPSNACRELQAAFSQCTSGHQMSGDPSDIMQSWWRAQLKPRCAAVLRSSNQQVELVMQAYKIIEAEMFRIINTGVLRGNLVLLGGVQINMPCSLPGYFMPLHFSIRSAKSKPINLMSAFR